MAWPSRDWVGRRDGRRASRAHRSARQDERHDHDGEDGAPHRGPRRRTSRDGRRSVPRPDRRTASRQTTSHVIANPALHAPRRGCSVWPSGKIAATSSVQPIAWWRNAAREKSHGFCSWIRNAAALTSSVTRERQRPPAARQLAAHERELDRAGEHRDLGPRRVGEHVQRRVGEEHRNRPEQHADRERDRRPEIQPPAAHREDSVPTIVSASRISPSRRKPAAKPQ